LNGRLDVSFYTVTMPRFRNGTRVLVDLYAIDDAANTFNMSATYPYLEYLVLGNWLETFNVTISALTPGQTFTVEVTANLRNASYQLQVVTYFYYPDLAPLESILFPVWKKTAVSMTQTGLYTYSLTWPYGANLTHGAIPIVSLRMVDATQSPLEFYWNGSYSLTNTTLQLIVPGGSLFRTTMTANVTLGKIIDNIPPTVMSFNLSIQVPTSSQSVEIHVRMVDIGSGVSKVVVYYRVNDEAGWHAVASIYYNGEYIAIIPKQGAGATVYFYIEATDAIGNSAPSAIYSYSVAAADYSLYIFLIAILGVALVSMVIMHRIKTKRFGKVSGRERYKLIKHQF
jgi:hypothetical protein